jgi:ABC-type nitrate/sulfonate/bicarbonate transport system substrate-binding protein
MTASRRPLTGSSFATGNPVLGRRGLLQASALVMAGVPLLAACGSDDPDTAGSTSGTKDFGKLAIQLSWIKNIEFAGEYFADSKGYYAAAGFSSVELIAGPTAAESVVASGKALVGLSAPPTTAAAIGEGAPLKIIGATFQKNPFCITSLKKTPIATPQDMIGKKIGVQSSNTSIFDGFLKANKIDPKSLTIVPVQFDPTVLTTGDVDGFMSFLTNEPITLAAQGNEVVTLSFADNGLPLSAETFTVLQSTIDNDREKLKAFLTAEIKGWNDALADDAAAAKLTVETYGKDQKLDLAEQTKEAAPQKLLIQTEDAKKNGLFLMSDELIAQNIQALAASGTTITADKLFDMSLLKEIYAADPSLIVG